MAEEQLDLLAVDADAVLDECRELYGLVARAICGREVLTFRYVPKPDYKFDARDLADIEKAISDLVKGILTDLGSAPPRSWRLRLSVSDMQQIDDGEEGLLVTLDFAKLIKPREGSQS